MAQSGRVNVRVNVPLCSRLSFATVLGKKNPKTASKKICEKQQETCLGVWLRCCLSDIFKPVGCLLAAVVTSPESLRRHGDVLACTRAIVTLAFPPLLVQTAVRSGHRREQKNCNNSSLFTFLTSLPPHKDFTEHLCSPSCSIKVLPDFNICCVNSEVI